MLKFAILSPILFFTPQFIHACTHTARLTDTYGDGWNGGIVKIQVNGVDVLTNVGATFTSGSGGAGVQDYTFSANAGDVIAVIETAAGSWSTEMRVEILDGASLSILAAHDPVSGAGTTVAGSCPSPMSIVSSTVTQSSTSSLTNCSSNSQIVRLEIVTSGAGSPKSVTQIQTNFTGTAIAGNISLAKIYSTGTSSTFSTTTLFGTGTASATTYNINGSQVLSAGTNYFWLTYNLNNTGTIGNTVDAVISQYTASAVNYTDMTVTNPAGTRTISICVAPGGVYTGLETWVKADAGITGTTPITAVSNINSSGTAIVLNGSPNLNTTATTYNYNPYIDFTAPVGLLSNGAATNRQFLKLSGYDGILGLNYTSMFWVFNLTDLSRISTHIATVDNVTNATPANGTFHGDVDAGGTIAAIMQESYDITDFGVSSPAGTWQRNGGNIVSNTIHTTSKQILSSSCTTGGSATLNRFFGGQRDLSDPNTFSGHPRDCKGPAAELIGYTSSITSTERQKIHSYLAIKYGTTIGSNYLSTTGSTIYSYSGSYINNIIGIGRDDAEALYQKQSHNDDDSVRFYLGSLSSSNSSNVGTFSSDVSYLLSGANTGKLKSTTASTAEIPGTCGVITRLEREWKVTKTNISESVNMDVKLSSASLPGSVTVSQLCLLVDDDGNFSNGGTACYSNGDGSGIVFTYSNPLITITGISSSIIANNTTKFITIASLNVITPLPVELIDFNVNLTDRKTVDIKWTTLTEINNDYFKVEKSTDTEIWVEIEKVDGAGNSFSLLNYISEDKTPVFGNNYYRLKQVDFNGEYRYSEIKNINITATAEIQIFPIPANNSIFLIGNDMDTKSVHLINSVGQEINYSILASFSDFIEIDVENLIDGVYFIQINLGSELKNYKIIINH